MPQVDPTHQHWASQIITDNSHTPITPGGAVAVTDGTTTVANTTTLHAAGMAVSDGGSGIAVITAPLPPLTWDGQYLIQPVGTGNVVALAGSDAADTGAYGGAVLAGAGSGADGGAASVKGGSSSDGTGNASGARIYTNGGAGAGVGGAVLIYGGNAAVGGGQGGGYISLTPGAGDGAGPRGNVLVSGLPTSDPGVAGALYSDGTPSAGVPKPLMASGG